MLERDVKKEQELEIVQERVAEEAKGKAGDKIDGESVEQDENHDSNILEQSDVSEGEEESVNKHVSRKDGWVEFLKIGALVVVLVATLSFHILLKGYAEKQGNSPAVISAFNKGVGDAEKDFLKRYPQTSSKALNGAMERIKLSRVGKFESCVAEERRGLKSFASSLVESAGKEAFHLCSNFALLRLKGELGDGVDLTKYFDNFSKVAPSANEKSPFAAAALPIPRFDGGRATGGTFHLMKKDEEEEKRKLEEDKAKEAERNQLVELGIAVDVQWSGIETKIKSVDEFNEVNTPDNWLRRFEDLFLYGAMEQQLHVTSRLNEGQEKVMNEIVQLRVQWGGDLCLSVEMENAHDLAKARSRLKKSPKPPADLGQLAFQKCMIDAKERRDFQREIWSR